MKNVKNPHARRRKGFFLGMLTTCVLALTLLVPGLVFAAMLVDNIMVGDKSLKKAEEVVVLPMGSFDKKSLSVDSVLEVGDEISCVNAGVVVVLRYIKQPDEYIGDYKITSPFKAIVVPATDHEGAAIAMLEGTADALATDKTEIQAGEVTLGSERTQYGIKVSRSASGIEKEAFVFEGKVTATGPGGTDKALMAGEKLEINNDDAFAPVTPVGAEDIRRAAATFARLDVGRAARADRAVKPLIPHFTRLHADVLQFPGNAEKILKLVEERIKYGVYSASSLLYLDVALRPVLPGSELWKRLLFLKARILYERGDSTRARSALQELVSGSLGVECK